MSKLLKNLDKILDNAKFTYTFDTIEEFRSLPFSKVVVTLMSARRHSIFVSKIEVFFKCEGTEAQISKCLLCYRKGRGTLQICKEGDLTNLEGKGLVHKHISNWWRERSWWMVSQIHKKCIAVMDGVRFR